jgi:UDP-N-acetylmuramoyl-tripeptide--D-alanyl-D-alanine ligase
MTEIQPPTELRVLDLVRATRGALVGGDLGVPVRGVSIDSRTVAVGDAFFAIRGHRLDGHSFVDEAIGRGAACVVVHAPPDDLPAHVPVVVVEDTTAALGRLAAFYRARFDLPIVAITGSNGKTTTKEMVAAVLGRRLTVLKPEGSLNNQWGVPLTILRLTPAHQALVLEMGTSMPGDIAYLAALAGPTMGVVTTVSATHTERLGSPDGVAAEKSALVRALPAHGRAILNADDRRVRAMAGVAACPVLTFGREPDADVRAIGPIQEAPGQTGFTLGIGADQRRIRLAFSGRHNVTNALAAATTGHALGFSIGEIAEGLESARPAKGRCVWREAGAVRILDDTYNANPASVAAALETLLAARGDGRAIVALGDMLELGAGEVEAHREIGRAVARAGAAELVGCGPLAGGAVAAAREAGLEAAYHALTYEETVAHLLKRLAPGDLLLVKGSRAMRMERVVDTLVARLGKG